MDMICSSKLNDSENLAKLKMSVYQEQKFAFGYLLAVLCKRVESPHSQYFAESNSSLSSLLPFPLPLGPHSSLSAENKSSS